MRDINGNVACRYLQLYRKRSRETAKLSKNKRKKVTNLHTYITM